MRRWAIVLGCVLIASLARGQGGETGGGGGPGTGGGGNLSTIVDDAGCVGNDFVIRNAADTLFDCNFTVPLAQLADDDATANKCLVSGGSGGPPSSQTCPGGGSPAFSAITTGTNTGAAMTVGTGASMAASGSGTITATGVTNIANQNKCARFNVTGQLVAATGDCSSGDTTGGTPAFNSI